VSLGVEAIRLDVEAISLAPHVLDRLLCLLLLSKLLSCGGPWASVKPQHGTLTRIPVPPDGPVLVVAPVALSRSS